MLAAGLLLCAAFEASAQVRAGGGGGGGGGFGGGGGGGGRSPFTSSAFGGGASSASSSATRDYSNPNELGSLSVAPDENSRTITLSGDEATLSNALQVIRKLDRPKPQVLLNAVFLEVSHEKDLDFGVEGAYTKNPYPSLLTNFNMGQNFGLAGQGTVGSLIGGNTMPTGEGLYTLGGNNFQATLRAIASAGNATVLSRPSILVRNNQPATITVGQSVPLVQSVTYNSLTGTPIDSIQYQSVGVILQVTPFISDNNTVEMIVAPQISSLSSQTVAIAQGVAVPVINLRSASTVVVTPDGQTVVIGGLMENDKTVIDTKIPLLGDIPGLGALFRRKQTDNTKTELMIFLTPHVVPAPEQLASLTTEEAARAKLAPQSFEEEELNQFLETMPFKKTAPAPVKKR
jgi:general secretion pathway protein D